MTACHASAGDRDGDGGEAGGGGGGEADGGGDGEGGDGDDGASWRP